MNIDSTDSVGPTLMQPTYSEYFTPSFPMEGLHTQQTPSCADQPPLLYPATPMDDSKTSSPTLSNSGSSARDSSDCTDDDTFEREQELSSALSSLSSSSLEPLSELHSSIPDASPIFVIEPKIAYGAERLIFIENLICTCHYSPFSFH
jgi:hypothetical protein